MRKDSVVLQYQVYFHAATLGAESNSGEKGFRPKDLKFLVELFANWMEATLPTDFAIHNTQITRYLSELEKEGFARKLSRGKTARYALNRAGVIGVLQRLVERSNFLPLEHFFFVQYFIRNYGSKIDELARAQGASFPKALKLEIDALKDPRLLKERQLRFIEKEIQKLQERIDDAAIASRRACTLYSEGKSTNEVVAEIQKHHPYKLNSQKPMGEMFAELPENMRRMELEEGALQRAELLWIPLCDWLAQYRALIEKTA